MAQIIGIKILNNDDQIENIELDLDGSVSYEKYKRIYNYEVNILNLLDKYTIEKYAIDELDLVEDNECDCEDINDLSDDDVINEMISRNLLPKTTIITQGLYNRFTKLLETTNPMVLDEMLSELENYSVKK